MARDVWAEIERERVSLKELLEKGRVTKEGGSPLDDDEKEYFETSGEKISFSPVDSVVIRGDVLEVRVPSGTKLFSYHISPRIVGGAVDSEGVFRAGIPRILVTNEKGDRKIYRLKEPFSHYNL